MRYAVVVVGSGPAGLSAALALGRGRKRVLLCDSGPRRNAAAVHVQNFVTRDGTPPEEFRRIGHQQLAAYPNVELRAQSIESITGQRGAFSVQLGTASVEARRILLCTGMVDEGPDIEGFRDLWGRAFFQCPYCQGGELEARRFAVFGSSGELRDFALLVRGWAREVTVLTNGPCAVPPERAERLGRAGVRLEQRRVKRLVGTGGHLQYAVFDDGSSVPLEVMFAHPPQRQVPLVRALGVTLDAQGYVASGESTGETSVPGIYAAGDLVTPKQAAIVAAASGMQTATLLNHELTIELATTGALP